MQTTLRIDDDTYRQAKSEAARMGITLTRYIEEALRQRVAQTSGERASSPDIDERNRLMEALLRRTAHFRIGPRPTRDEIHGRQRFRRHERPDLRD